MNEEALEYVYNDYTQSGYDGSVEEFTSLLSNNREALDFVFNDFAENGYDGSIEDFSILLGISEPKEGVFEEDREILIEDPKTQHDKDKSKFDNIVQKERDIAEIGTDESFFNVNENIEENLRKELARVYGKWGFVFEESGFGDYITVSTTDPENIQEKEFSVGKFGKIDEEGIAEMKQWLNDNRTENAVFLEEAPKINKYDLWEKISADENLKDLTTEEIEQLSEESDLLNDFSRQYFASEGLDWDKWKELEKEQKYNDDVINFVEEDIVKKTWEDLMGGKSSFDENIAQYNSSKPGYFSKEEAEKYSEFINPDGSLKQEVLNIIKSQAESIPKIGSKVPEAYASGASNKLLNNYLTRNKKLASILTTKEFQQAEDGMKQMLAEVRDEAQVEVVKQNKKIVTEFDNQTQVFEKATGMSFDQRDQYIESYNQEQLKLDNQLKQVTGGVGFDGLKNYKPKSQQELDAINSIVNQSQQLYNEKMAPVSQVFHNIQALNAKSERINELANNALLLMNYQDIANFRGEYAEDAFEGVYNETLKGWSQGDVNRAFLNISLGITDIDDPEQLAKVSQRVALQNAYAQGKLSTRVFERYLNAGSVAEQMALIGQNPVEILASLFSSSMSQFASTGVVTFAPIVGGAVGAGAAAGLAGGPFAAVTVPGGALTGLGYGMTSWSTITGFSMELGAAYSTVMAKKGVDLKDANAIAEAMRDETIMEEAFDLGVKRGIPIALMNLASGMAGNAFVAPLASPTKQIALGLAAKTIVDPVFEGLGEGMAQVVSGEGLQMTEVFNEMVGGQFGNQSTMATKILSNTVLENQSKQALKMLNLDNVVDNNYKLADIRKYVNRLKEKGKLTEEDGETIINNAIINDAVNNLLNNKKKTISDRVKKVLGISNSPQRKRLARLIEEKQNFSFNKELVSDIDAEIQSILDTGVIPEDKIELVSDYRDVINKEMRGVNAALKALGIDEALGIINIDNIEEIENNPEAKAIIQQMMDAENENMETPYESISEYLADQFAGATHSITPKELGKQFTLFSGKNMMLDMITKRGEKNRTGTKGFRHEALHFILDHALSEEEISKIANDLETYMEVESTKDGGAISAGAYARVKNRLDGYKELLAKGEYTQDMYNQEVFTTLSDAINDDDLLYERQNKKFWQKIADDLVDFFKYRVRGDKFQEQIDAKLLSTPEGAFEFLKNYNKAFLGQNKRRFKKIKVDAKPTMQVLKDDEVVEDSKMAASKMTKSLTETPLEAINQLLPDNITTKQQYDDFIRDNRTAKPIIDALNKPGGVINNYIRSKQETKAEGDKMIEEALFRLFNFNPEAKRKDGTTVGKQGFGEAIFANTRFAKLDARKKLFQESEKKKRTASIDDEQARQVAAKDDTSKTPTTSKKDRVTPRSKIKKAAPELVTQELEDIVEVAVLEIMEGVMPDVDSKEFKPFIKEVLEGKLTAAVKKKLGLGKNYDFLIKKLGPKLKKIMPVKYFVKLESQIKPEDRTFTKPPVRLTKQADIDAAVQDDKAYVENTAQGVNMYKFKDFNPQDLIDFILAPAINPKTGKKSGLKGTRKTSTATTMGVELGLDMMPEIFKGKISPQQYSLMLKKIQRKPGMRFSKAEKTVLDSAYENYISDQKFWSKFSTEVGGKNYDFNNPQQLEQWKKKEFPKLVKIFSKDFLINSGAFYGAGKTIKTGPNKGKKTYKFPFRDENPTKLSKEGKLQPNHKQVFIDYLNENFEDSDYGPAFEFEKEVNGKKVKFDPLPIALKKIGQKTPKFNDSYFGSKENIENNEIKDKVLKEIFLRIQNAEGNIIPAAVGMLRTTAAEQAHFMRKIAPTTFRQLGMKNLAPGQITEEHALGASLTAKQALLLASDKLVNDNFVGIQLNYFQGPISKVNDDKVNRKELGMKEGPQKQDLYDVLMGVLDGWLRYAMVEDFNLNEIEVLHNGKKTILTKLYGVYVDGKITPEIIQQQNALIVRQIRGEIKKSTAQAYMRKSLNLLNKKQKTVPKNNNNLSKSKVLKLRKSTTNSETIREAEILDKALNIARDPKAPVKKIRVFDFDDTLARTKSNVLYTMPDGKTGKLTAEEFAKKGTEMLERGADFDFSEFNKVMKGKKGPLLEVAKAIQDARGTKDVFVLTARAAEAAPAIKQFLDSVGLSIPLKNITGLGDSSPLAKSGWIVDKAAEGYNDFYFADDHMANVNAVKRVLNVIDVKSKVQQAKLRFSKTVDQMMNNIIFEKTGIEEYKEFSQIAAQARGRKKKSFDLIPPSAQDFGGLLYKLLAKGETGNIQWEWMQEHLIKPYGRAMNDLSVAQNQLMADFRALKESLVGIPKNLKKEAIKGFTNEDVVRVATWDRQGIEVEGISKRDLEAIRKYVEGKPDLNIFIDQLIAITKGEGYYYPGKNWLAGTITTDFREGLRQVTRKNLLQQWQENVDLAFNKSNMNKLEAAFGPKYREALENSLQRMSTGQNRRQGMSRVEQRFLDYINNSVGAVMFLNARSAVLQTISAANFINWKDNNPMKAALAFANQKQYWSDFITLMNSDFLVDRRNGLKINVSESEIAEAAKTSKNTVKGVISLLLNKGFVFTQIADSFAIATGGATLYRNRIKTYMKEGMSEAEAIEKAFLDFRELAEESQQSARADKISQQQASTLGRLVLAFANTPSQYARIMDKAGRDLINGRGDWKANMSKIAYYGFVQNLMFTALQTALFALAAGDDDDEEPKIPEDKIVSTANSMADNILKGIGIHGVIISAAKNTIMDLINRSQKDPYFNPDAPSFPGPDYTDAISKLIAISPPLSIKLRKIKGGITDWYFNRWRPEAGEIFNINNPSYRAASKVIAGITNVPLDRLFQKMENIQGAMDDVNPTWQRIFMALGWPKWQLETEKEKEKRKAKEKKERRNIRAKEDPAVYTKAEQVSILKQYKLSDAEIKKLKNEDLRVKKIIELRNKTKRIYTPR